MNLMVASAVLAVVAGGGLSACVDVHGGAVELSWSLRTLDGKPVNGGCGAANIATVRLFWRSAAEGETQSEGVADFACKANRGATDFVIAEGEQLLRIEPVCDSGSAPLQNTYKVPPPIRRQVRAGEVVTVNALLIVVEVCGEESGSDCTCGSQPVAAGAP
jgi:hypothetical protein